MRRIVFVLSLGLVLSSACSAPQASSSAASAESLPPSVHFDVKPAAADGYVFVNPSLGSETRSPDGWREGGVALTRDATAPAGFTAYAGSLQLVDATDGSVVATARPDTSGLTSFANIEAGLYKLRVATAPPHDFPITLIGGATVRWGVYPITRPRAYDIARQLVSAALRPNLTFVAGPQTPVPTGVIVSPALEGAGAATDHPTGKPSWFFYFDPFVELRFDHPVKYVFVDATTGDAQAFDATSWPALNRQQFYRLDEGARTSADVLQLPSGQRSSSTPPLIAQVSGGVPRPRQLAGVPESGITIAPDHVPGCSTQTTYALLVEGSDESAQDTDMTNIKKLIPSPNVIYEVRPGGSVDKNVEIKVDWGKIKAAATACDSVFMYVTAHATSVGEAKLETPRIGKHAIPVEFDRFTPSSLDWGNCLACHITIILDYCHSGWELDRLKDKLDKPGKKVVVLTSSDKTHESGSFGTWSVYTTGGAFTTALTNAFAGQSAGGGTPSMTSAFSDAQGVVQGTVTVDILHLTDDRISKQNPQSWFRIPKPGETCAVQPSSTIDRPSSAPPPPPASSTPPSSAPPTPTVPRQTTGAGLPETTSRATGSVSPLARIAVLNVMIAEGTNNGSTSLTDPVVGRVYQGSCPSPLGTLGHTWRLYIRVEGQNVKLGDQVHLVITGPNLPPELTVTLDDSADTTLNLPGHTMFIGPFPVDGTINVSVVADKVNGVPFAFQQSRQTSLNCG